ncbi:MAG TPA: DUF3418 domain-containing protein, partial [Xanthomonadaceae bacterium]|nr:DUF3418 domain-containing protein [Xanthomonadaceae bacterium]
ALALAERMRQARRQLPVSPKTALLHAALQSGDARAHSGADSLQAQLGDGAFADLSADGLDDIRDAAAFAARRDALAGGLFPESVRRLQRAEAILDGVAQARIALESPLIGWAQGNLDDMRAQLAALVAPGFLRETPAEVLAEYPRYLKAIALRAERALRDPARDQARMLEVKPFADAVHGARAKNLDTPEWHALRWDLEELRVSLFAQELGVKGAVSPKKLAARLAVVLSRD